jgi:hypothetical protein
MALFDKDQTRDIREYVFQMKDSERYKILQVVRMLQDDNEDEDTITSTMYHLCKNPKEIDKVFTAMTNSSLVSGAFEE